MKFIPQEGTVAYDVCYVVFGTAVLTGALLTLYLVIVAVAG